MPQSILWEPAATLHTIIDIQPQLASWDKSTHPSQLRLRAYLQTLMEELLPELPDNEPLYLNLDIDVKRSEYLLRQHDLENYLTPLFGVRYLSPARFALVTARKHVGGGSRLEVGTARPAQKDLMSSGWTHFSYTAQGSLQSKQWKENLQTALADRNPLPLISPAVEVQIAWVCAPKRNWASLWKPTGDCMGPILGEESLLRPFAPNDDRIVNLKFHHTLAPDLGNTVQIDMWWRDALPISGS